MPLIVSLGLTAAFLFALSASLQQRAAHQAQLSLQWSGQPSRAVPVQADLAPWSRSKEWFLGLARRLWHSRLWLTGWVINLAGFLVQGAALHVGSVTLVQPLLVLQLFFALPLTTWWTGRWPSRRAWLSGGAICGGVAMFLVLRGHAPLDAQPDRARIILAGISAVAGIVLLVRLSARRRPLVQSTLIAIAAGLCFAMTAVLMKMTAADLVDRGIGATAADWPGYLLGVSAATGVLLGQWAFALGSLPAPVAAMTITNPIASYLIGVLAFHAEVVSSAAQVVGVLGAGALICAGVVGLSHSSIVRPTEEPEPVIGQKTPVRQEGR